jgi:hypothetical protein
MIDISKASLTMVKIKKAIKFSLRIQGRIMPTLFLFNKEKQVYIKENFNEPLIHGIVYDPEPNDFNIYTTSISFLMNTLEDEKKIHHLIHMIVGLYRPNVISYVSLCRFMDISFNEKYKRGSILKDPSSLRGVRIHLYTEESRIGFNTLMPFIDSVNEKAVLGEENAYNISFIDYPWYPNTGAHKTDLKNPYFE